MWPMRISRAAAVVLIFLLTVCLLGIFIEPTLEVPYRYTYKASLRPGHLLLERWEVWRTGFRLVTLPNGETRRTGPHKIPLPRYEPPKLTFKWASHPPWNWWRCWFKPVSGPLAVEICGPASQVSGLTVPLLSPIALCALVGMPALVAMYRRRITRPAGFPMEPACQPALPIPAPKSADSD